MKTELPTFESLLAAPHTSHWLRSAVESVVESELIEILDIAEDAKLLSAVINERLRSVLRE